MHDLARLRRVHDRADLGRGDLDHLARARHLRTDLAHNLAVVFWITANAWWMLAEFFGFDERPLVLGVDGRHLSKIPFALGAPILVWHYAGEWFGRLRPPLPGP